METQEKQKPKSAFYESAFKLVADFEAAKNDNGNIDDFKKYPMYRALRYKSENHEAIAKLCNNANLENIAEGTWVIEQPKMVNDKIQYKYMDNDTFHKTFKKYDASGVLGCGPGSERFNNL